MAIDHTADAPIVDGVRAIFKRSLAATMFDALPADITLMPGECVELQARNPNSVSALFAAICGETRCPPSSKFLAGEDVSAKRPHELARIGMSFGSGRRRLIPSLTPREHLRIRTQNIAAPFSPAIAWEWCLESFSILRSLPDTVCGNFSGGQQQALMWALCALGNPALVVVEEPWMGMAKELRREVVSLVGRINRSGSAILLLSQSSDVALSKSEAADPAVFLVASRRTGGSP